jgi:hypothetical protein
MESRAKLREELEEAIAKVREQISVQSGSSDPFAGAAVPSGDALAVKALEDELAELEEALADLDSDQGGP